MAKSVSGLDEVQIDEHSDTHNIQILSKHYQRLLNQWPVDLLRPEVSFQKVLQKRIDNSLKPSTAPSQDNVVSNQAQATVPTPLPFDEKGEIEQVNVLYSFLENRYTKKVGTYHADSQMLAGGSR